MSARARVAMAVALVCAVLGTGGCDGKGATPQSAASASGGASPSAVASPSPTVDLAALQASVTAAAIPPNGLGAIEVSVTPKDESTTMYALTDVCRQTVAADYAGTHVDQSRKWSDQGWLIQQTVHGYPKNTGASVVAEAKVAAESCKTYMSTDGEHTLLGAVQLPAYPGVEALYGYCQSIKRSNDGKTYVSCQGFLAKGHLVSSLFVVHGSTQKTNSSGLIQVAAIAAESLSKAP
jgi:hypothetical protein